MLKEITASGKDVTEAKENARAALGVGELDDVQFEVLHAGSRGIFGIIGVKPAQVRAYIELPDREAPRHRGRGKGEKTDESNGANGRKNANGGNNGRRGGNRPARPEAEKTEKKATKPERPQPAAKPSKPKAPVIPEAELSFEKKTVAEGEDVSFDFVKTLIRNIGLDAEAELLSCEDGTRRINIEGSDAALLIGHHGDTLDALQYLANLASAQKNIHGERDKTRVTIDIEGYRAKREETLRALARRMAAKALRNKRSVMLEPMTAYERRIIHSEVQSIEGVSTNSVGSDNNRKIVIFLTDKKADAAVEAPSAIPIDEEFPITPEETTQGMNDTVSVSMVLGEDEENAESNVAVRAVTQEEDACVVCENAEACVCSLDDEQPASADDDHA